VFYVVSQFGCITNKPTNQPQKKPKKQQKNKKLQMGISFLACLSCFHRRPKDMKIQVQKKTQLQQHQQQQVEHT
jgi:hypothetical protein